MDNLNQHIDQYDEVAIIPHFAEWIAERDELWNAYYDNLATEAEIILRGTRDEVKTSRNGA